MEADVAACVTTVGLSGMVALFIVDLISLGWALVLWRMGIPGQCHLRLLRVTFSWCPAHVCGVPAHEQISNGPEAGPRTTERQADGEESEVLDA